jgi:hypothetical protein
VKNIGTTLAVMIQAEIFKKSGQVSRSSSSSRIPVNQLEILKISNRIHRFFWLHANSSFDS